MMEKLSDADLIAAVKICCGPVEYTSCDECPAHEWCSETHTDIMYELERRLSDLRSCLDAAKNGRLELARKYQALRAERDDLRKDVEAQGEIILELNRDLKRCREALNAQGEYKYLGGDLISRNALTEAIENVDWYHQEEVGISTRMWKGASSEEDAWFKAPDIFDAVRGAAPVEVIPVEVVRNYLVSLVDEWHNMGDPAYELPNVQVYNHVRKCLDDLDAYCKMDEEVVE